MQRTAIFFVALFMLACTAFAADAPATIHYTTFDGKAVEVHPWRGKSVMVLTQSGDLDPAVMAKIVNTLDGVFNYYKSATGSEPDRMDATFREGRTTIAEVDATCGAGCGYLGATGIELQSDYFQTLYKSVKESDQYDQVVFYEFGRNFWLYHDQLEYKHKDATGSITTGYAVFMRFMAMRAVGVKGAPFNDHPFTQFEGEVKKLVDTYVQDKSLDWSNTLLIGKAPKNAMDLNATDLFASFLFRLYDNYGKEAFVEKLWREVAKQPKANTTQDAVDNLVIAASHAAGSDLSGLFKDEWRWPVSPAALAELKHDAPSAKGPALIPTPQNIVMNEGAMSLDAHTRIVAADEALAPLAHVLADEIADITGIHPTTSSGEGQHGDIVLRLDPALKGEAYNLTIDKPGALVSGGNYDSIASATATLLQLLRTTDGAVSLPYLRISDEPAYPFRAALIDLARKYHTPAGIKQVVELCRLYKIRFLHVHLTDDHLFMFPSTAFPQAGKSNEEFARFEPRSAPKIHPYALDDLKDVEAFARDRGVHIIPELDLPGHSGRLIADVRDTFGFPGNGSTVDIASPKTLAATTTLLNEVMDVFSSTPYVHLGADEVGLDGLEKTPEYAAITRQSPKIKNTHDLYCKFVSDLCAVVKSRGKTPIVWEEGWNPDGAYPLPKDAVVMSWSLGRDPNEIVKAGYSVVNASWTPLYIVRDNRMTLDFLYTWDLSKFGHEGSKEFSTLTDTHGLLGAQLCSWEDSESIEIQMLRNRLALVAERTWNPKAGGLISAFSTSLAHTNLVVNKLVQPVTINVDGKLTDNELTFNEPITITLSSDRPAPAIRYTLDNNIPDESWKTYKDPIRLDRTAHLRAGLFDAQGKLQGYLSGQWFKRSEPAR